MKKELLTITEFCSIANIGRTNAYRLINSGAIKAVKIGKKTLIPLEALEEWISSLTAYQPRG
ncbi:MAG TPA: helix-turn-helix domain-containing protein [Alphaproteobacteria bacterium]|nr:helix-turn-helix domain-containing protein [Alphaproteobacteria bacterium]